MRRRPEQPLLLTFSLLLAGSLLAGCSGSGGDGDKDADPQQDKAFALRSETGKVSGKLPSAVSGQAAEAVSGVVEDWLAAAYVEGDWPRTDFSDAWPGFTPGAAKLARQDEALTSNAGIGGDIDGVEVEVAKVSVDLLGVRGKAQGATARFRLVFTTSGDLERRVEVGGRVNLTRVDGKWRIFAYDIHRGATATASGAGEEK